MIAKIKQAIQEEIEQCGNPSLKTQPVGYGVALGLKAALGIVQAVCKIEENKSKPTKKEAFERTCECQMYNPISKQILCDWFYNHMREPYQIYCHFPECNLEKCPLTKKEEA